MATGVVVVLVAVAGAVVALLVLRGGPDEPAPVVTVTAGVPTPTVTPAVRAASSTFAQALPATVLQYVLASSGPTDDWLSAGALEAWSDTYTDGGPQRMAVTAGQWATPDEAAGFAAALRLTAAAGEAAAAAGTGSPGAGPTGGSGTGGTSSAPDAAASAGAWPADGLPRSGDVVAGGQTVGTFTVVDGGDGTGSAVWTNGASAFRIVAPVAEILDLYAAYPW